MYRVRQKNCPTLKRCNFLIFSAKMKQKYHKKAYSLYNQGVLTFFTAVKYSMRNGSISQTSQIASLFTNMALLTVQD